MFTHNKTRRGTALVLTSIVILTIAGMAMVMTDLTINRYNEQKYRQSQVDLLAATESAANEAINWLKNNESVQEALRNMTVSDPGYPSATTSTSAVLVSSSLPSGLPEVFPQLVDAYSTGAGGTTKGSLIAGYRANEANRRNSCLVEAKVIKVASDAVPSIWNGTERFIVYTTAMYGDPTNPKTVRRQRVEAVITALPVTQIDKVPTTKDVPTPAFPFTRGLFSKNGYDVKGTAETDSWNSDSNGDGIADTPYVAPTSYTVGGPNSNGDLGSNGVLGTGAYDTNKIHGTATPNAGAQIPNVIYNPPTEGYTKLTTVTGDQTISGTSSETTVYRADSIAQKNGDTLTIDGSGTVVLYVDGSFDIGNINFAEGSTANLVIYQNDIAGKGATFNSNNTIGDPNDPKRFMFLSAFSGTGSNELTLNGGASFSGVVLAPNAGIKFNGNTDFYGAFVAADFSGAVNGTFNFHYDESLAGLSWGEIMTPITTLEDVTKYLSPIMAPTAWNVSSVGYHAP